MAQERYTLRMYFRYTSWPIILAMLALMVLGVLAIRVYERSDPDVGGVNWALDRAIQCWFHEPNTWKELVLRGMRADYSWKKPAQAYATLYEKSDSV